MWLAWCGLALAQQVPGGDFEGTLDGWVDQSEIVDSTLALGEFTIQYGATWLQASPARGGGSLAIGTEYFVYGFDPYFVVDVRSPPFVVTRHTLAYAEDDDTDSLIDDVRLVTSGADTILAQVDVAGAPSADTFSNREIDVSGACGADAQVEIDGFAYAYGDMLASIDDIALTGTLCADFADGDGDGLCPMGTDLDGDGGCDGDGELSDQPVDCDDADAALGACLRNASHPLWGWLGAPYELVVEDAIPGERVILAASYTSGSTCVPPARGDVCLDLGATVHDVASATADADGVASLVFTPRLPNQQPFTTVWIQAFAPRATGSVVAEVIEVPFRPRAATVEAGPTNGDFEDARTGWGGTDETYGAYFWYTDWDLRACTGGSVEASPARGVGALQAELLEGFGNGLEQHDCVNTTRSWPFRVTHTALSWAHQGGAGTLALVDLATGAEVALSPMSVVAADGFTESVADLASSCGAEVFLDLGASATVDTWDDIRLDGLPCPDFRDLDGDGLCAQGVDLDGDRACVSAGEPSPVAASPEPLVAVGDDLEGGYWDNWYVDGPGGVWTVVEDPEGGAAGRFDPVEGSTLVWEGYLWITHQTAAVSVRAEGLGDWRSTDVDVTFDVLWDVYETSASPRPDEWTQVTQDVRSACNSQMAVLITASGWAYEYPYFTWVNDDALLVDDVGLVGEPCPTLVDTDGDGLCAEGADFDGDGLCIGMDEVFAGYDPDE